MVSYSQALFIRIFLKINRSESFTTHSKLTMLLMLIAAARGITIKLPSSTFCPQNLWARLYTVLLRSSLLDSEEIFLLPSAPLNQSSSAAKARTCLVAALPHGCSAKACKRASILSSQALYQQCVGHQAQLRHLPGSSFLPTHTLTGGFYFSFLVSTHKTKQKWQFTHLSYQVSIFSMDQDNSPKTF